ncbi:MAG: molecular chaperone TorD family protein [Gemmatimonadota bacterium]|nr:molecular chaperone TorD family protein [Gemmatimonadota bacterium]
MTATSSATPAELVRALAVLTEPPSPDHARVAEALGFGEIPGSSVYTEVFLFQLFPFASVYLGEEGMLGGEAGSRIAGFWSAVGHQPPPEPDHLGALLGLYAALADAEGARGDAPRGVLAGQARRVLLHEHLAPWLFAYLSKVEALAGPFYARWASVLGAVVRREVEGEAPFDQDLPAHLREAAPLPDPRTEGSAPFLDGLVAFVRTGMILTRADLTRLARTHELGMRMGERRYILEHLLAQDAVTVFRALAEEAGEWTFRHEERVPLLGSTARFFADRATRTAALLTSLADEGETFLTDEFAVKSPQGGEEPT